MRFFVTGATGHIGTAVTAELIRAGHGVLGLARSDASAAAITAAGGSPQPGSLDDLDVLRSAADGSDGVIHLAFGDVSADMAGVVEADLRAIDAMAEPLEGTGKPFIGTNATLTLSFLAGISDRKATEEDALPAGPRADAENTVLGLAERGIRSSVIRIPPLVHSPQDRHGLLPQLIRIARSTGIAGFVGDGANRWPAAHTLDIARLYRLAVEDVSAGQRLHAVAEEGPTFRRLAEWIGEKLDLPVEPVDAGHFAHLAMFAALDNPISSEITRRLLDWRPEHPTLEQDVEDTFYWQS